MFFGIGFGLMMSFGELVASIFLNRLQYERKILRF